MPDSRRVFSRAAAALAVIAATATGCTPPDVATGATTVAPVPGPDLLAAASNNDAARVRDGSGRTALDNAERLGQVQMAAILRSR